MVVTSPRDFFERELKTKFDPSKAAGITCIAQMNISGENGGDRHIIIKDQKLEVHEGAYEGTPTITVKMKDTDYVDMINGKITGERAYMTGKLKFKGDISVGMKLKGLGIM